jgi:hypothetical protein
MIMDTQIDAPFTFDVAPDVQVDAPFVLDVAPGVEPGFELAPIEPMTPLAPLSNDVIDGDWRVIDSPVTSIKKPLSFAEPMPMAQPETHSKTAQPSPLFAFRWPSFQMPTFELPLPSFAWVDGLMGFLSFDWLLPVGRSGPRAYAPVDYLFYAVPSRFGADAHYHLVNVCKLKVASESFDDLAEYRFSVPVYQKKRCERALDEIVPKNWRRIGG